MHRTIVKLTSGKLMSFSMFGYSILFNVLRLPFSLYPLFIHLF